MIMLNLTIPIVHNMLRINRYRLDEELELQGEVAAHIAREVAKTNSRMIEAADKLKRLEGELLLNFRSDRVEKETAPEINARVLLDRERIAAFGVLQAARYQHEEWTGLQEGWKQRSHALSRLSELHSTDYFSQRTVTVNGEDPGAIDRARAALRSASDEPRGRVRTRVRAE